MIKVPARRIDHAVVRAGNAGPTSAKGSSQNHGTHAAGDVLRRILSHCSFFANMRCQKAHYSPLPRKGLQEWLEIHPLPLPESDECPEDREAFF